MKKVLKIAKDKFDEIKRQRREKILAFNKANLPKGDTWAPHKDVAELSKKNNRRRRFMRANKLRGA